MGARKYQLSIIANIKNIHAGRAEIEEKVEKKLDLAMEELIQIINTYGRDRGYCTKYDYELNKSINENYKLDDYYFYIYIYFFKKNKIK